MNKRNSPDGGVVYSTDQGRLCPECGKSIQQCRCKEAAKQAVTKAGVKPGTVRLQLERKGRNGKDVTVINGVPLGEPQLLALAKELKQRCGAGGSVKNRAIEIQGDHRKALIEELRKRGYDAK